MPDEPREVGKDVRADPLRITERYLTRVGENDEGYLASTLVVEGRNCERNGRGGRSASDLRWAASFTLHLPDCGAHLKPFEVDAIHARPPSAILAR